jgi:hypothetical protein
LAGLTQTPPQARSPGGQEHVPFWQTPLLQTVPQPPQLFGLVAGLMQAPLQHRKPGGQACPQPPQLDSSDRKLTQRPAQQFWPGRQQFRMNVLTSQSLGSRLPWQHVCVHS